MPKISSDISTTMRDLVVEKLHSSCATVRMPWYCSLPLLDRHAIDMIVLAGFLLMMPVFIIERYHEKIINIHPSLLPKYGGKGMYGHHVHAAVVAAGETETGITVHFVSERCDEGNIIFQTNVPVAATDTPEDVERKVHSLEREHFPRIIDEILSNITTP